MMRKIGLGFGSQNGGESAPYNLVTLHGDCMGLRQPSGVTAGAVEREWRRPDPQCGTAGWAMPPPAESTRADPITFGSEPVRPVVIVPRHVDDRRRQL